MNDKLSRDHLAHLSIKVYADDVIIRETDDQKVVAAVMSYIAKENSNKHSDIVKNAENYVKYGLGQQGVPMADKSSQNRRVE